MPKIVILNGPPRSGKDSIANNLKGFLAIKFAGVLKKMTHAFYGMSDIPSDNFEEVKDLPSKAFYGLTPREAYIAVSEQYIKPVHGLSFFGYRLVERIKRTGHSHYVISDSGFYEETIPLIKEFGINNIYLFHLTRPGFGFDNDSRIYLDPLELGLKVMPELVNDSTMEDFIIKSTAMIQFELQKCN